MNMMNDKIPIMIKCLILPFFDHSFGERSAIHLKRIIAIKAEENAFEINILNINNSVHVWSGF